MVLSVGGSTGHSVWKSDGDGLPDGVTARSMAYRNRIHVEVPTRCVRVPTNVGGRSVFDDTPHSATSELPDGTRTPRLFVSRWVDHGGRTGSSTDWQADRQAGGRRACGQEDNEQSSNDGRPTGGHRVEMRRRMDEARFEGRTLASDPLLKHLVLGGESVMDMTGLHGGQRMRWRSRHH